MGSMATPTPANDTPLQDNAALIGSQIEQTVKSRLTPIAPFINKFFNPNTVDAALAGVGLALSLAVLGWLELMLKVKLFALPMMASGLIFFAQAQPPNPKGFYVGTIGACVCTTALVCTSALPIEVGAGNTIIELLTRTSVTRCNTIASVSMRVSINHPLPIRLVSVSVMNRRWHQYQ